MRRIARWLGIVLLLLVPATPFLGESVKSLPSPTGYISDFAGVLSSSTKQDLETLCSQVDRQAHAQIAVVTIKTLDNDQTVEEFATELEDKWGVGNKDDRGVLIVLVMTPRRGRIEVGYGLEGILNDAKVGDIGRSMAPAARQGDYNAAVPLGVRQIAGIIAQDAGVTLTLPTHQYHRQPVSNEPIQLSLTQIVLGGGVILLILFFLIRTGNVGLIFFLLGNLMGGGGGYRGGGGRDRDGDGGFGGFGGGRSGGGGASGDF